LLASFLLLSPTKLFERAFFEKPTCFHLFSTEIYFWLWPKFYFWTLKAFFALLHVKFPIDGYASRSYWFWPPNSVFGLWRLIFTFLTSKSIFFLATYKTFDRWIYYTIILILASKFRFWALKAFPPVWSPNVYFFMLLVKFPIGGYVSRSYWFRSPNTVFRPWRLIFIFCDPQKLATCKIIDRWIYHKIILILKPKFRFWALTFHGNNSVWTRNFGISPRNFS
jgi:hypothetical protein